MVEQVAYRKKSNQKPKFGGEIIRLNIESGMIFVSINL